jgi:hypothetical protein
MRTIVGGRPQKGDGPGGGVARGIDVLLLKGAVDPEFRELLGRDWRAAAQSIELDLTESECAVLASIPSDVLGSMSARMHVPKAHQPIFRGRAAAAMLALVAGLGAAACAPPATKPGPGTATPLADPVVNEPGTWAPRPIAIAGLPSTKPLHGFESPNQASEPGDDDPDSVNEPEVWDPPVPRFGIAPELNERTHDYESEDETR